MHYVFGDFSLDTARYELRRAGNVVPLRGKVFDVLAYLVRHADRVVSREELLEQVWPDQFIAESTLTSCMKAMRQALGDTGRTQHLIKTVHGRGYRCLAPVTELDPAAPEAPLASSAPPPETVLVPHAVPPAGASTPEAGEALVPSAGEAVPDLPWPPSVSPASVSQSAEAERRPLTVLVCDLVQAAQLAEQLDPEDLRQVMRAYHRTCESVLAKFDGYLAQQLGSRLVVYFGYPQAHEDAAQRAVLTGLALLEAFSALNLEIAQQQAVTLSLRVGIDSGRVVVEPGGDERAAPVALGSPQSRALQLQEAAAPQSVVISSDTQHLVQGWFRCDELLPHVFQGSDTTVPIYQVRGRSGVQHRLAVVTHGGLTPLVGREHEVELLSERWHQVSEGQGQVVVLSGEAGIGKSRLVQVLKEEVIREPHVLWECRSSPYYQNTAFYPITELLQRVVEWQLDDDPVVRLGKLEAFLSQSRLSVSDTAPLLAPLLSLPLPERRYPPLGISPQRQRQKTLESLVALVLEQTAHQPVLLILEDLHWTDPTTLELLELLVDQVPTASILILITYRPEFQPTWGRNRSYLTQVTLNRLSRSQIELIAMQVADGKALPDKMLEQIVARTDGVPLHVEEMTKALLESGVLNETNGRYELTGPLLSLSIPSTLQDSLMARLDRLVTAKAVVQYASVIGRQFSYELLQSVLGLDEAKLQRELGRLVEAELVYQRGVVPNATYLFKHALVQDTAYESLLRSTRQGYHRRIAEVLTERFAETAESQPELLAHHYTEAGLNEQAISYWQQAGQEAVQRSAHVEAIAHLNKGLALLPTLPDTSHRAQQELTLHIALGPSLIATRGHAAPEVEQTYKRAYQLSQQIDDSPQLFQILVGLRTVYGVNAEFQTARELGEPLLALAQRVDNPEFLFEAHYALGNTAFWSGDLRFAHMHLEQGLTFGILPSYNSSTSPIGQNPRVSCLHVAAWNSWLIGYSDRALQLSEEALALAKSSSHLHNLAYALVWASFVHQHRQEVQKTQAKAENAITLSEEQGFRLWLGVGTCQRGWALAKQGKREGLIHMHQGQSIRLATSPAIITQPQFFASLAEAYGINGQEDDGLAAIAEAQVLVDNIGGHHYEAELHRLKGELLLQQSPDNATEAESCFQQAITIAQNQSAKSWELRAATSLARLWQSQGKRDEARELLEPIYSWCTEGFDTADLIDAKTLLDEFASSEDSPIRHGPYDGSKTRSQTTRTLRRG